jgi:hypothetical protein
MDSAQTICPECGKKVPHRNLTKHLNRAHPIPADPSLCVEEFLRDPTIKALYRDASARTQRRLRGTTLGKFVKYERQIDWITKNCQDQVEAPKLGTALEVKKTIRDALTQRRFTKIEKKSRPEMPIIYSGGLPGLGKRN